MTTFTTPPRSSSIPFCFLKVQDIPSVLHSSISPHETSGSTYRHGVGGLSYRIISYHIITYHITYPTASSDRSSDYTNEANARRLPIPFTNSPFISRAVGLTSPFLFSHYARGKQHEALEGTKKKKHTDFGNYNVYIPREGEVEKRPFLSQTKPGRQLWWLYTYLSR